MSVKSCWEYIICGEWRIKRAHYVTPQPRDTTPTTALRPTNMYHNQLLLIQISGKIGPSEL